MTDQTNAQLRERILHVLKDTFNIGWNQGEREHTSSKGGEAYRDGGKVKVMLDGNAEQLLALLSPPDTGLASALDRMNSAANGLLNCLAEFGDEAHKYCSECVEALEAETAVAHAALTTGGSGWRDISTVPEKLKRNYHPLILWHPKMSEWHGVPFIVGAWSHKYSEWFSVEHEIGDMQPLKWFPIEPPLPTEPETGGG